MEPAPPEAPAPPPPQPLRDLQPLLGPEDLGRALEELLGIVGEEAGARVRLEALVAFVEPLVPLAEPEAPPPAQPDSPPVEFDDFAAQRLGAAVWICHARLPRRLASLPGAIQQMGHTESGAAHMAVVRARRLRGFTEVLLRYSESVLGLARGRPAAWNRLCLGHGTGTTAALASDLLVASRDAARPMGVRETALVTAAGIALVARDAGGGVRLGDVWGDIEEASESGGFAALVGAAAEQLLAARGQRALIVDLVIAASEGTGRIVDELLEEALTRALMVLGCRATGVADLDPLTRGASWSGRELVGCCPEPTRAKLLTFFCLVVGFKGKASKREPDTVARYMWARATVELCAISNTPPVVQGWTAVYLAFLAQMDLRERRGSDIRADVGASADERGDSAYHWLRRYTVMPAIAPAVRALAQRVLDIRMRDDEALVEQWRVTMETLGPLPAASTAPGGTDQPEVVPAPTDTFRPEQWVVYDLVEEDNYTNRQIAAMVARARGSSMSTASASRWHEKIASFLAAGGKRPPNMGPDQARRQLRFLSPDDLERGRPGLSERPGDATDGDADSS